MSAQAPLRVENSGGGPDSLIALRLAGFLATLRDNGFAVGPREGEDAATLIASGHAERPALLRSAFKHLFSSRKRVGQFDGIFDAFWLGKRVRSRSMIAGAQEPADSPSHRHCGMARGARRHTGAHQLPRSTMRPKAAREGRRKAPNRPKPRRIDFRKLTNPEQSCSARGSARLAQAMRTR